MNPENRRLKVVVYAITLNEEKFVSRWMESMREADEVVVLDTGSTDGTVESLRREGAKVWTKEYRHWKTLEEYDSIVAWCETPWRFDVARNDSLSLVPRDTDICVCTDLDEILCRGWREKLETAWRDSISRGIYPTTGTYEYVWNFNADGSDGTKFTYQKIHTLGSCKWEHPVHEVLSYSVPKVEVPIPIRLEHHADPRKSRGEYLPLLAMSCRECPNDDRNAHYYGRELMFHGDWEKAIVQLKSHLAMPTARWNAERAASMRFIARCENELGNRSEAYRWLRFAMKEAPNQREAAVELAQMAYDAKDENGKPAHDWKVVVEGAEFATGITKRDLNYTTSAEAWGAKPWDLLSLGYWYTGREAEALFAVDKAISRDPDNSRLRQNKAIMLEIFLKKKNGIAPVSAM